MVAVAPRSVTSRCFGTVTVLMPGYGGALVPAAGAAVRVFTAGTHTAYPLPLYGDPDTTAPLVFPVTLGNDGVLNVWADAPDRVDVGVSHPTGGDAGTSLDVEPVPTDTGTVPAGVALLAASQTFTGINHFDDEIHSDGGLVLNSTTYLANPMNVVGDQAILPDATGRGRIGSASNRFKELWSQLGDVVTAVCGSLTVAGKPVAVSPDAANALEWRANGLYSTDTTGTAGLADPTTTKGDLIARGAAAPPTRLGVGADGETLVADATQALGLKWGIPEGLNHTAAREYDFGTSTNVSVDPSAGSLKCNTGNLRTATILAADSITAMSFDISFIYRTLQAGDVMYCQEKSNSANWVRYALTAAPTDMTGWWRLQVSVQTSAGSLATNTRILCVFWLQNPTTPVDVVMTGDNGIGVVESPSNTFALTTKVSPDAGNGLTLAANGLKITPKISVQSGAPSSPATGDLWVW